MRHTLRGALFVSGTVLFAACANVQADPPRDPGCLDYCARIEASCSQAARKAAKDCSRLAATGGVDPFTQRREQSGYFCGFFRGGDHCAHGYGRAACIERFRERYTLCTDAYTTNTASEYLQCGEGERRALGMCRDELAQCRASC